MLSRPQDREDQYWIPTDEELNDGGLDDSGAYVDDRYGIDSGDLSPVNNYINLSDVRDSYQRVSGRSDFDVFWNWLIKSNDYHYSQLGNFLDKPLTMEQKLENMNNVDDVMQNAIISIGSAYLAQGIAGTVAGVDRQINRDIGIWQGDMVKYGSFQNVLFYANMYAIKEFLYDGVKYATRDYIDTGDAVGNSGISGFGSDAYWYYARPGSYGVVQGVGGWMRSKFGDYLIKKRI